DRSTGAKQLSVLNGISAETADAKHADHPIGPEPAGIANLLDAAIRRQPRVGERRELLELQMFRHFDHVARRNRNRFRKAAVGPKAGPAHIGADVRVADLAMAAHTVTPSWRNHHMVARRQARSFWNNAADLVNRPGDLVAWNHRRRNIGIALEKTIDKKHVRPAHAAGLDLDEHFVGLDVRNRNVCEDERFLIIEDACRFHVLAPFVASAASSWASL